MAPVSPGRPPRSPCSVADMAAGAAQIRNMLKKEIPKTIKTPKVEANPPMAAAQQPPAAWLPHEKYFIIAGDVTLVFAVVMYFLHFTLAAREAS